MTVRWTVHEFITVPGEIQGVLCNRSTARQAAGSLKRSARKCNAISELCSGFGRFFGTALCSESRNGATKRRERIFGPEVTFWSFLHQALNAGSSCREVVRGIQRFWKVNDPQKQISADTGAYCRARAKLPSCWLETLRNTLSSKLTCAVTAAELWHGKQVRLVDGTTASMPDTNASQQRWPQHCEKAGCGFPIMRVVGLFCLHSGALLRSVQGSMREAESRLARGLWNFLNRGEILLGDRGFCSYADIARLLEAGVDSVLRLHQRRRSGTFKGRWLGKGDRIVTWKRPYRSWAGLAGKDTDYLSLVPELKLRVIQWRIEVPGFRTKEVVVVTTLLDPKLYPAQSFKDLYLRRWRVELHYREIKEVLGTGVLRCKNPEMVERELLVHQIAYNLVRCVMQEAAFECKVDLGRISFKGTLDTMLCWAPAMHHCRGAKQ